ncbi:hypothetical protein MR626_12855, partial [bacterium]|nr:hypothetical protein [bacterium]
VAIRFLLGNMFEIGTLQGERIATPVCGLVRNDREIGPWFLKLMTLPLEEKVPQFANWGGCGVAAVWIRRRCE